MTLLHSPRDFGFVGTPTVSATFFGVRLSFRVGHLDDFFAVVWGPTDWTVGVRTFDTYPGVPQRILSTETFHSEQSNNKIGDGESVWKSVFLSLVDVKIGGQIVLRPEIRYSC